MRRKGFVLLVGLALAGLASVAQAQVLPATPLDTGLVMLPGAESRAEGLQFTVEVRGRAPKLSGGAGEHFLTFNAPLQVPGAALEPGRYMFRLVAPSVMQVVTADHTRSLMFMVTPIRRADPSATYEIVLRKTDERYPMRLAGLFVPDTAKGFEPLYGPPSACERILRDLNISTSLCFG